MVTMESGLDKLLQRQRFCRKCSSYVTFVISDDGAQNCPLCHAGLPSTPRKSISISIEEFASFLTKYQSRKKPDDEATLGFEMAFDDFFMEKLYRQNAPANLDSQKAVSSEVGMSDDIHGYQEEDSDTSSTLAEDSPESEEV